MTLSREEIKAVCRKATEITSQPSIRKHKMTDINLDTVELKNVNATAVVGDKEVTVEVKDKDQDKKVEASDVLPV